MAAPLELRHYLRTYTLEDVQKGLQPVRTPEGIFCPPVLQWRYRERVMLNDKASYTWSEWQDVPFVREDFPVVTST